MQQPLRTEVVEAAKDYKYLLNRGFPQKASLDFVSARYRLSRSERNLLMRCVHRDVDLEVIKRRTVSNVRGVDLVIDGYNVFLTVASAIEKLPLFLCDDGFIRDIRSTYTKDFNSPTIKEAIEKVIKAIELLGVGSALVVLDKNISWSARHAEFLAQNYGVPTVTATKADIAVIGSGRVVCSSDFVILLRSDKVYDLAQFVIRNILQDVNTVELLKLL